jgi:hypothetical protein
MTTPSSSTTTAASTSPRFGYWIAFFIFSTITLGATIEAVSFTTTPLLYAAVLKTRAP